MVIAQWFKQASLLPLPCSEELKHVALYLSLSEDNTCYKLTVRSSQWPFWRHEANWTRGCPCTHHAGVWGVGRLVPSIIHLGVRRGIVGRLTFRSLYLRQRSPRCSLNRGLVGSESRVDLLERIKSAAFARNPRCRGGAEVKLHKYYPSVIDRCDWTASNCVRLTCVIATQKCVCTPAVTLSMKTAHRPHLFFRWESKWGRLAGQTLVVG